MMPRRRLLVGGFLVMTVACGLVSLPVTPDAPPDDDPDEPGAPAMESYIIYDRPSDHPDGYIVRKFLLRDGEAVPTSEHWTADSLEEARRRLPPGLHLFVRDPRDHPSVVETWL